FADASVLQLTFNESIAPADQVNPRQFRLSAAFAAGYDKYAYGTSYQDVGRWNGAGYYCDEYCYEYCDYDKDYCKDRCFEYCYIPPGDPVHVSAIIQDAARPEVLLLRLDNAIGGGVCAQLNTFPEEWTSGLFIHYTTAGSAPVADPDGEALAPIAEHWVLAHEQDYVYVEGQLPFMDPLLPIPCPF
ncbi:MAG: hypothetical protein K0V04_22660, partial [Deltaproteobacteria bacterium]|nr:hypothetical protein [Deltaproteobacteria bacterium]